MEATRKRIAIIGAGLAGLSAAYHLEKSGFKDYLILERESEIGGLCRSFTIDGFVFDYAGHILFTGDKYVEDMVKNVLLNGNFIAQVRRASVFYRGVHTEYPFQANLYGQDPDIIKECIIGLIKARYQGTARPRNFEDWIYSSFGEGIGKHFMIPDNEKQWHFDLKKMNYDWIRDRVPVPEIEDVLEGALKPPHKVYGPNSCFLYPAAGGIGAVARGFLPWLSNLMVNSEITGISLEKRVLKTAGLEIRYGSIISTIPLYKLVSVVADVPAAVKKAAQDLEFNVVYTVNLGIDRPNISVYHWVYFPEGKYSFRRVGFPSNLSPSMAPAGKSSVTAEISFNRHETMNADPEKLADMVIRDLQKAGVIEMEDKIIFRDVRILNPAYVIFDHEHDRNVKMIHDFCRKNSIYPCGRFGDWEYLNMDHAILSGRKTVEAVLS